MHTSDTWYKVKANLSGFIVFVKLCMKWSAGEVLLRGVWKDAVGGNEQPLLPQQHPDSVSLHGNW